MVDFGRYWRTENKNVKVFNGNAKKIERR